MKLMYMKNFFLILLCTFIAVLTHGMDTTDISIHAQNNLNNMLDDAIKTALIENWTTESCQTILDCLKNGADPNHMQYHTPKNLLMLTIEKSQKNLINYLLNHPNINIDARDYLGRTALHYATDKTPENFDINIVEKLLQHGANPNAIQNCTNLYCKPTTPLCLAAQHGLVDAIDLLVEHGADVNLEGKTLSPLQKATNNQQYKAMATLLRHRANPNAISYNGKTSLTTAAWKGDVKSIQLLLQHGVDVNHPQTDTRTPLEQALRRSNFRTYTGADTALKLCAAGASLKFHSESCPTAFHWIAQNITRIAQNITLDKSLQFLQKLMVHTTPATQQKKEKVCRTIIGALWALNELQLPQDIQRNILAHLPINHLRASKGLCRKLAEFNPHIYVLIVTKHIQDLQSILQIKDKHEHTPLKKLLFHRQNIETYKQFAHLLNVEILQQDLEIFQNIYLEHKPLPKNNIATEIYKHLDPEEYSKLKDKI